MRKLQKALVLGAGTISGLALAGIVASVFLQVIFRYVLSLPLSWSEELARMLFAWSSMMGAAAGAKGILEQGFDILTQKLPDAFQKPVDLIARTASFIICAIITVKGFELVAHVHQQTSSSMGIRMSYVYAAVPVGMLFLFCILAFDTYFTYASGGKTE